jgi:hypothetical protein
VFFYFSSRGPWGARGWPQFCFAKLLLAHATWIEAEILFAQRAKRLERKARFLREIAQQSPAKRRNDFTPDHYEPEFLT